MDPANGQAFQGRFPEQSSRPHPSQYSEQQLHILYQAASILHTPLPVLITSSNNYNQIGSYRLESETGYPASVSHHHRALVSGPVLQHVADFRQMLISDSASSLVPTAQASLPCADSGLTEPSYFSTYTSNDDLSPLDQIAGQVYDNGQANFVPGLFNNSPHSETWQGDASLTHSQFPVVGINAFHQDDFQGSVNDARLNPQAQNYASRTSQIPPREPHFDESRPGLQMAPPLQGRNLITTVSRNDTPNTNTEVGSSHTAGSNASSETGGTPIIGPERPPSMDTLSPDRIMPRPKRPRSQDSQSQNGIAKSRRRSRTSFQNMEERQQTGITRRLGACVRCQSQKIRCLIDQKNRAGVCLSCVKAIGTGLSQPVCSRSKVADAKLFAKGKHPQFRWSQRWKSWDIKEITDWETIEVKVIWLTQEVGNLRYPLRVRRFKPRADDSVERQWKTDGASKSYKCQNYAIENMKETCENFAKHIDRSVGTYIKEYIDQSDWLFRETYDMTLQYAKQQEGDPRGQLVRDVLRLWVGVRMESRSEYICGQETLGMRRQELDPKASSFGKVLVPPVMSAQLEMIATSTILEPKKKEVLHSLKDLMAKNQPEDWFAIYLCMFILLHSCAMLTGFEETQALKYGGETRRTRFVEDAFVRELHHGSTILLHYFHGWTKGGRLLLEAWATSAEPFLTKLNTEQIHFIEESLKHVEEKGNHIETIRRNEDFADPYFFVSQLFDRDWKPIVTI